MLLEDRREVGLGVLPPIIGSLPVVACWRVGGMGRCCYLNSAG
jgi:hypothetical protein